jgi:hypothetical protein
VYATTLVDAASDRAAQLTEQVRLRGDSSVMAIFSYYFLLFITDFTAELELKISTLSFQGKEYLRQHMLRNFIEGQPAKLGLSS